MANLVLSGFQRRMGEGLGVKPGDEMKAALDTASDLGIPYALCDREIQITLRRAWARCGFWSKCKLLAALVSSAFSTDEISPEEIENLKNKSELDGMMEGLAEYLPTVKETLIDERDRCLAAKIWEADPPMKSSAAQELTTRQIAVVGAGHCRGIEAHLRKIAAGEESADVSELETVPAPGFFSHAAGWIIPILIVVIIALGFLKAGAGASLSMLIRWVLWNGSLAALGTLLALGHPLAILVSFVGAPIATINPFIGVGLFSGVTQAVMKRPRVEDAENIASDVSTLKGVYQNRISHALLVFFLSSIGGVIGNIISIPSMLTRLFG
jgi:pheromone shutdown-related protein TraB